MTNRVVHFELQSKNIEQTRHFYRHIFGWKIKKWKGPFEYWMIMTGDTKKPGIDGGVMLSNDKLPNVVNTIDVEDIDKTIKMLKEHNAKIIQDKMLVAEVGYMAYFKDPDGNVFGIIQMDGKVE